MKIALIDSGRGALPTAAALRALAPDLDLLILSDPAGAPWGGRPDAEIIGRVQLLVDEALREGADAVVLACNTASLVAREAVRERLEPEVPVIATVPAIKPAAIRHGAIAIWGTPTTVAHPGLAELIATHAGGVEVTLVACPGLAEAIEAQDAGQVSLAIDHSAGKTPADVDGIVLGCTHYALAGSEITGRFPRAALYDGAESVARQVLRRVEEHPRRMNTPGYKGKISTFSTQSS